MKVRPVLRQSVAIPRLPTTMTYCQHLTVTVDELNTELYARCTGWEIILELELEEQRLHLLEDRVLYDTRRERRAVVHFGSNHRSNDPTKWKSLIPPHTKGLEPIGALLALTNVILRGHTIDADSIITPGLLYSPEGNGRFTDVTQIDIFPPRAGRNQGYLALDWDWNKPLRTRRLQGIGYGRFTG